MISKLETVLVEELPLKENMEVGYIYVSQGSMISTHLNPFNEEEEIMTPFLRGGFRYYLNENNDVTVTPTIHSETSDISYQITQGYAIKITN